MKNMMLKLWKDEEGATIIEYVLLAALIAVVAVAAITQLGKTASGKYDTVNGKVDAAGN